jgi:chromosome transmission fidelity protein 1
VNEVKKTEWGRKIRVVSLASRKNLCINEEVLKLKSQARINDKCLDMQKTKTSTKKTSKELETPSKKIVESSCAFLSKTVQGVFRDHALVFSFFLFPFSFFLHLNSFPVAVQSARH